MANVFGILTAIVLAVAAFFAFKNRDAYGNELIHRKIAQDLLAATEKRLGIAETDLASTTEERVKTDGQVVTLRGEEADRKKSNAALKSNIDGKKQTADSNKKELDQIREKTEPIGPISELASTVRALRSAINELKDGIATNEGKLANLSDENTRVEGVIQVLNTVNGLVARRESYFSKTRIQSIYPNWGFVTLGAGSVAGVVANSNLEVVRDGVAVAKLLVTAVENNTASASIVPDSLAQDTVLMVGDQVVASHKSEQAVKPKAPAAKQPVEPAADAVPSLETELGAEPVVTPEAKPEPEPEAKPSAESEL